MNLSQIAWGAGVVGQLKATVDDYPYHLGPPTEDLIPYVSFDLSQKVKFNRSLRAQWKVYGLTNTSAKSPPENFYGDIPEALIEIKALDSKFRLGMNTINWGIVDVSSPSDVVNTLAIFHPLRTWKQGAPLVEFETGPDHFNVDLIYIPVQRPPLLPSKDSRWLPREILLNTQSTEGQVILPKPIAYEYDPPITFDHALNNNFGGKFSSHLGSWDFQVTHFEGSSPTPKVRPTIEIDSFNNFVARSPIHLAPVYYRVRTTGLGFVWAREKWIYRGETAYQHSITKDELVQPWSWTSVLAAETNVSIASHNVTLLGQAYYSKNPRAADNMVSSSYRLFDGTGVLGARWAQSDVLSWTVSALYQLESQGLYAGLAFDNKLTDHLRWGLSWRNSSAAKEGLIKTYAKNSHGSLDMTYFF